jgi:NADPH:quinone reductase-like Zn-dependent oxidoreductase
MSKAGGKKLGFMMAKPSQEDLGFLKELLEAARVKPVIDRRYPLGQTAEAIRYIEEGHAQGKVVITFEHNK